MSLDIITSPVSSLTDSAALREVLGTTSTGSGAAQDNAVKRATAWAETYIGRPIKFQVYREVVAGYGDFYLLLSRRPIRSVLRVFRGTDTGTATEYTSTQYTVEHASGRLYRPDGWEWTVLRGAAPTGGYALDAVLPPPIPFADQPYFLVEYSAGWVGEAGTTSTADGTTSTGRTLPHDVELGILAKAGEWMTFGAIGGPTVMSKSVGDLSISYGNGGFSAGSSAAWNTPESLLNPYRSV